MDSEKLAAILTAYQGQRGKSLDLSGLDLREANFRAMILPDANLSVTDMREADLWRIDLSGAKLRNADLRDADLCGADLRRANLRGADLRGANLREANFWKAELSETNLRGAHFNWQSHDLVAEVLHRWAENDVEKLMVAGLILLKRNWCWRDFLALDHKYKFEVLTELQTYGTKKSPFPQ